MAAHGKISLRSFPRCTARRFCLHSHSPRCREKNSFKIRRRGCVIVRVLRHHTWYIGTATHDSNFSIVKKNIIRAYDRNFTLVRLRSAIFLSYTKSKQFVPQNEGRRGSKLFIINIVVLCDDFFFF